VDGGDHGAEDGHANGGADLTHSGDDGRARAAALGGQGAERGVHRGRHGHSEPEAGHGEPGSRVPGAAVHAGQRAHRQGGSDQPEPRYDQDLRVDPRLAPPLAVAPPGGPSAPRGGPPSRSPTTRPAITPPIIGNSRTPLASASSPRTSWKYRGIANSRPNSANDTRVVNIVPQVKLAERNSVRSTSGWPLRLTRRSQATNAASRTTPATIAAIAMGSPQPPWPALITP